MNADDAVLELLESVDSNVLIRTFASLTHRIHAAEEAYGSAAVTGLQLQRNKVAAEMERRMAVGPAVIKLWNDMAGWIPGAAYERLAETVGTDPNNLVHWDPVKQRRHTP
jgi:hypothetical protein